MTTSLHLHGDSNGFFKVVITDFDHPKLIDNIDHNIRLNIEESRLKNVVALVSNEESLEAASVECSYHTNPSLLCAGTYLGDRDCAALG